MTSKSNLNVDNGYYNIWLRNTDDYQSIPAFFNEQRRGPVLERMEDFTVAVVRFKLPGTSIPLFVFEDNGLPTGDPGYLSEYTVSMAIRSGAGVLTNYLEENVVFTPGSNQLLNSLPPYNRFVYYYRHMLQLINNAVEAMWTTANGDPAYQAVIPVGLQTVDNTPRFVLRPTTPFIEFQIPADVAGESPFFNAPNDPDPSIVIFLNPKLFYFLSGFSSFYFEGGATVDAIVRPNAVHMLTNLYVDTSQLVTTLAPVRHYLPVVQDYSSLHLWQRLSRILLTTDMPVAAEEIGVNGQNGENFSQVLLTDFEVEPNQAGTAREWVSFYPQGELRRYNFTGNGNLSKMSLRIYFQLQTLDLIPLHLAPGFDATIKLQFQRRQASHLLQQSNKNEARNM